MVVGSIIAYQKKMDFIYIATLFKDEVRKQGGSDAFVKKGLIVGISQIDCLLIWVNHPIVLILFLLRYVRI